MIIEAGKHIRIERPVDDVSWNSDSTEILHLITVVEGHIDLFSADVRITVDGSQIYYTESHTRLTDEEWRAYFRDKFNRSELFRLVRSIRERYPR